MRKRAFLSAVLLATSLLFPLSIGSASPVRGFTYSYINEAGSVRGKKIVLDPGHGGFDTGAVRRSGLKEKEVTLAISTELKLLLEAQGAEVILTRDNDRGVAEKYVSARGELQARADTANRAGADLFISIHADAFEDRSVGGTTTYYFAKSGKDAWLAAAIQRNLTASLQLKDRGYLVNDFYVLKHTSMPAALVEVAFISNPAEESLLKSKAFIQKAAQGIFRGIAVYLADSV
ncbi:MAG: N-acetylmuramoyl-L-alanine amidase [Negativicutes bacterium]|nr:N-acetylmuramoyl-L-alanine amidase [Negativicutes bacterium]